MSFARDTIKLPPKSLRPVYAAKARRVSSQRTFYIRFVSNLIANFVRHPNIVSARPSIFWLISCALPRFAHESYAGAELVTVYRLKSLDGSFTPWSRTTGSIPHGKQQQWKQINGINGINGNNEWNGMEWNEWNERTEDK